MDISVTGAKIIYQNDWFVLSEAVVNTWIVMAFITALCLILTHKLKVRPTSKRQIIAEFIVQKVNGLVHENMGDRFCHFGPLVAATLSICACCSLSSLLGMFAPTGDLSTMMGWALVVFVLITYYKIKTNGLWGYIKGYFEPLPPLMPINVISEVMTPMSMAFRHYGNVAAGSIISLLIYAVLAALSKAVLGLIPGAVGAALSMIPIFQVGLPAIFSIYFDLFSGCVQAFIFCMLMMVNISVAAEG